MELSVPSGAQPHRPDSLIGSMLRTVIMGRLCPMRAALPGRPPALPPMFKLPESLLAGIFSFGGLPLMLNASLSSRTTYGHFWDSPLFWRTLLQAFGFSEVALRSAGLEAQPGGRAPSAAALQSFARRWLLEIDLLVGFRATTMQGSDMSLKAARRAVLALRPEDGFFLIQRAVDSIANLVRNRASGKMEVVQAEQLLEAVASRSDIFSTGQMLDVLGAHQKADDNHEILATPPKRPAVRPCRKNSGKPARQRY